MLWINRNGWIFVLIAAVMWAMDGFLRRNLFILPPEVIVFYEHLVGLVILLPIVGMKMLKEKLTHREFIGMLVISLLSGLLGTLWFTAALVKVNFISISVVYLIQKLQPIFAITSARIVLKEKIAREFYMWAALALGAGFFVTFPNGQINWSTGSETVIAGLFALGAAIAWGSSTSLSRMILINRPYEVITGWRFLLTSIMAFGFVMFTNWGGKGLILPSNAQLGYLVAIAVSTGMVALLIYYKGLKSTKAQVSTIIELTFPVLVVLMDGLITRTWLALSQYLAAIVLLITMYKIIKLDWKSI